MAYDPDGIVVGNATALSDDIDEALAASQALTASLIVLRQKVADYQDTPRPTLSLSAPVAKAEGNSGTTLLSFTLTLDRDGSTAEFPYSYVVTGSGPNPADAADFGGSYPAGSGTFAAGETVKTILILATGDTAVEPNEGFTITASAPGLASVSSTGTITNDDQAVPVPAFAFSGRASIIEGTPAATLPAFAFSGPASIVEGTPATILPAFSFTGPATIAEGTPAAVVAAFAFTGPGTIAEGNSPTAQYGFAGPATINEGN